MKNLIIAFTLLVFLIVFGSFVVTRSIAAQSNDLLPELLAMPAPPPPNPLVMRAEKDRPEEFYSKKNPPADDAPIDELVDYWKHQSQSYQDLRYSPEISDRSLNRLLDEIDRNPELLAEMLNVLPDRPEISETVKRLYDQLPQSPGEGGEEEIGYYRREQLKNWLKNHSPYFSDELLADAQTVSDNSVGYVTNHEALLALARVDFSKAKPILDRLYNDSSQPVSQTLARWALYRHALDTDALGDIERYRDELKKDVENKSLSDGNRDLAMDAISKEKDWSGRDEWYYGLLEDETLGDLRVGGATYTGLTTMILTSPPEKYTDKMIALLKSGNRAARTAAVRNLGTMIDDKNLEVVRALLPWLENKEWASEYGGERQRLVAALASFEIPESVPGLIALLDEKESRETNEIPPPAYSANMTGNTMRMSNSAVMRNVDSYPFRGAAVQALAKQKSPSAVPALRRILPQVETYERGVVIRAIYLSNGFSIPEQVAALETAAAGVKEEIKNEIVARRERMKDEEEEFSESSSVPDTIGSRMAVATNVVRSADYGEYPQNPPKPITAAEIKELLGQQIVANPEPSPELLAAVVQRINVLDRTDRETANALRRIILGWQGAAVNVVLLNDVKMGKADISAVVKLLSIRKELREKQINDVYAIRSGGTAFALGLSACLLETQGDFNALLVSENQEAKTAMFGCARLIRAELPLNIVAQNMSSPNKTLALAAEQYIESEDSPQARQIILAKYPNEAKILGATTHFGKAENASTSGFITALFQSVTGTSWFDDYYLSNEEAKDIRQTEKKLQTEVKTSPDLLGVYAYQNNFVRIYRDRVMFSFAEDESRYRERNLTPQEFENLKNYLTANRVDEQLPYLTVCSEEGCDSKELLMLGRQGGRRVYSRGYQESEFFEGLGKLFEEMQKPPAKLRYELEKSVAGLEILFADENLKAGTVWKSGDDLRVLVADAKLREQIDEDLQSQYRQMRTGENPDYERLGKIFEELRLKRAYDHLSWRKITGENLGEMTAPPDNFGFPPARDNSAVRPAVDGWKAKTTNVEIRADATGLYKISGGVSKKIREGIYVSPIVTPDGRWAVVSKFDSDEGRILMRVNLTNNQEFKVEFNAYEGFHTLQAVAPLPTGKKVLIRAVPYLGYEEEADEFAEGLTTREGKLAILDVETGTVEKTKGEIRPLASQTFRPLQKASASADEYWAAIGSEKSTDVGLYNLKTLTFKPLLTIPSISFDSMNMWIDEAENKVYFVYKGQLLALSLKK